MTAAAKSWTWPGWRAGWIGQRRSRGFAVAALAKVRIATTQMNVHFLGPISSGRITCTADVVHRTRRTATAEAKVRDADGTLLAMGTGAFRIFEQQGHPIV